MNALDDHDAPYDELTQLGERLRADADRRPTDVGRLGRRIHASRQRARLALVTGCAAVLLVLAVAVGLRSGGEETLRVGDDPTSATVEASMAEPMWTVNPSMALDPADGEVWAIDLVYDPALWNFQQLSEDAALQQAPHGAGASLIHGSGMSGYNDEPRVQLYWQGPDARRVAEFAHDLLVSRPGIVSAEVGPAKPTSYHPLGTVPPGGPVRDTGTYVVPEGRPTQDDILADGVVTADEYDAAFGNFVDCAQSIGAVVSNVSTRADGTKEFEVSGGTDAGACYDEHFLRVDEAYRPVTAGG